jgi:hypothetical protein
MNKKLAVLIALIMILSISVVAFSSCKIGQVELPTVNHEYEAATGTTVEEMTLNAENDGETNIQNSREISIKITIDANGLNSNFGIRSSGDTLGAVMGGLMAGIYNSDGSFTAKTINGIEAGENQKWVFYVNDEIQTISPDQIAVADGDEINAVLTDME